ncbi:hypothetical protein [Spiroplasma endosymbiont of 'Nebria riversi']|uniref:hypothetical protein n=1 Tax=Spiroplasma endosymbiont of 'Nebria riversi' TaxID=2792084 RepID=UPI001C041AB7|nr:hypothetical protein [Spiroplasma endosymbiont of 'Nebria riversi']
MTVYIKSVQKRVAIPIDSFYTKNIRIAEKKNNLKEVKKLRNIWKSDWKVTKLEIDLQNR